MITGKTNQVNNFLDLIYPNDENPHVALCLIPPDHQPVEHRFINVANLPKFLPYARFRNAHGWNVYITPSCLRPGAQNRRKTSFLPQQSILYLDCDSRSCLDEIKARYPYPTLVIRTSKGRYQVYWRLSESVPVEDQEHLMQQIAVDVGADTAATDVSRVLRLPAFWNRKPNRNNTVDVVFTNERRTSYKSLSHSLSFAHQEGVVSPRQTSTQGGDSRVLAVSMVRGVAAKGGLTESERDWYLINRWLASDVTRDECIRRIASRRQGQKRDVWYYATRSVDKAISIRRREVGCG